ncbi:hypothetical protein Tsubulata_049323 [Turnera subulata]|uniref:HhH-GPD domain-containing protein n=1 Tax=Turnera subulata TaxID=218843 RepID=A0A9Q0JQG4_9ROSI|nr:hypothetical protein Tsubulata_049323 [Turnera subulata]
MVCMIEMGVGGEEEAGNGSAGITRRRFEMEKAVCNHGFFMMAPNKWEASTKTLHRPLRLSDSITSVTVSIQSSSPNHPNHNPDLDLLIITVHDLDSLTSPDRQAILDQVRRMLRISEKDEREVHQFQEKHPEAKKAGFGRLFRSPSLFEDAVKSILLCNSDWKRSLEMAKALCQLQAELIRSGGPPPPHLLELEVGVDGTKINAPHSLHGRKRERKLPVYKKKKPHPIHKPINKPISKPMKKTATTSTSQVAVVVTQPPTPNHSSSSHVNITTGGNFPSSRGLANLDADYLKDRCKLGYRAKLIINLAKKFEEGKLPKLLENYELGCDMESAQKKLKSIKGFGYFATHNVLMCMGFYHHVPADTETIRLLKQVHARHGCTKATVQKEAEEIYLKYAPFQCLAYWFDLLNDYEAKLGKLSELDSSGYHTVAGTISNSKGSAPALHDKI